MTMRTTAAAGVGIALLLGFGGIAGTAIASATPSSTITVQDEGTKDGAAVDTDGTNGTIDTDGTVGSYRAATDGKVSGPIEVAAPQTHAG